MGFDLDSDDPEDAVIVAAAIDDDHVSGGPGIPGAPGDPGVDRPGCGCAGCLLPVLVFATATAAWFGALPPAAILCAGPVLLAQMDGRKGHRSP